MYVECIRLNAAIESAIVRRFRECPKRMRGAHSQGGLGHLDVLANARKAAMIFYCWADLIAKLTGWEKGKRKKKYSSQFGPLARWAGSVVRWTGHLNRVGGLGGSPLANYMIDCTMLYEVDPSLKLTAPRREQHTLS